MKEGRGRVKWKGEGCGWEDGLEDERGEGGGDRETPRDGEKRGNRRGEDGDIKG